MTPEPMRPFEQSLPMALLRARESVMGYFRPLLAKHGLTEQQWRVLRALSGGPMEVTAAAHATQLRAPSLSRILAHLVDRGLVARRTLAHDQRRSEVALTRSGRAVLRRIGPTAEATYTQIEQRFGRRKLRELTDLLDELASLGEGDVRERAS